MTRAMLFVFLRPGFFVLDFASPIASTCRLPSRLQTLNAKPNAAGTSRLIGVTTMISALVKSTLYSAME